MAKRINIEVNSCAECMFFGKDSSGMWCHISYGPGYIMFQEIGNDSSIIHPDCPLPDVKDNVFKSGDPVVWDDMLFTVVKDQGHTIKVSSNARPDRTWSVPRERINHALPEIDYKEPTLREVLKGDKEPPLLSGTASYIED